MTGKPEGPSEETEHRPKSYRFEEIPKELRELRNWVVWKEEKRANKSGVVRTTKVPYNARTGRPAKSNDDSTWSSHEEALKALESGGYRGAGFCLSPGYVGVDGDGCFINGVLEPWMEEIAHKLDSYTELSPSGTGVRIMVRGELPDGRRQFDFKDREHHGLGLYDSLRARYLTMTGWRIRGNGVIAERTQELQQIHERFFPPKAKAHAKTKPAPDAPLTDEQILARARTAPNGPKFRRLFDEGNCDEFPSHSEADLSLCCQLAFWSDNNPEIIERLFGQSALARDKWNDRPDYRQATIARAIELTTETFRPSGGVHTGGQMVSQT